MAADQFACTRAVIEETPDAAVVANLGVASWALASVADRERNFYMRGGMGSTTPTALGVALTTDDPVVSLDGDGSLLMSLGALSTVGEYDPANFAVVVWNNREYATTGGQPTAGRSVDFAAAAESCGLAGYRATSEEEFAAAYAEAVDRDGAALVDCAVETADPEKPPDYDYGHSYLGHRFREAMGASE